MSFRKEIKFNLNKLNLEKFLFWIEKEGAEKLHNKRIVNSIYFDNEKLSMYHDSVEGIIPRKKIRMRNYNFCNNRSPLFLMHLWLMFSLFCQLVIEQLLYSS